MLKTTIYLDNAATTKISDNVLNAMLPYLTEEYGNPSSIYTLGRNSAIAVNKARHQVAQAHSLRRSTLPAAALRATTGR